MHNYYPILWVGAIIGVISTLLIVTYSYIKKAVLKGHIPYEKDKLNQLEQGLHV